MSGALFLIEHDQDLRAAAAELEDLGFVTSRPARRLGEFHPLEVADVSPDKVREVEAIVRRYAPDAERLSMEP